MGRGRETDRQTDKERIIYGGRIINGTDVDTKTKRREENKQSN